MPTPHLIHPVPVFLRKADKANSPVMDPLLHEPVGQVRRESTIRLLAQVSWGLDQSQQPSEMTVGDTADGYLLFRTLELAAARVQIKPGDRIVKIGEGPVEQVTDLYIVSLKWMGHYPEHGGPTLLRAYFADRSPSRQR